MREIVQTNNIKCVLREDFSQGKFTKEENSLIAFSAQCNFNGSKYPLEVIKTLHENGIKVCLDAANFAGTNFLNLKKYNPDFICLSFYKLFGYPTGLGALIVKKSSENLLVKKYYGGGTVKIAMTTENWHEKRDSIQERYEDGTIPFLSIISLLKGFETLERLVPKNSLNLGIERISRHCFSLGKYLYQKLSELKYSNGKSVIKFYHENNFDSSELQGGIVNFNVLHSDGSFVGFAEISCMASIHNIYLRTGCFCNPGACQRNLKLSNDELKKHFKAGHVCGDSNDLIDGVPTGSVRVSIGYMTNKENVDSVIEMIKNCYMKENLINFNRNNYKIDGNRLKKKIKLKQICVFPIKSCGALKITGKWELTTKGLKYDREWMIVNSSGMAVTQKTNTKLCLIQPKICFEKEVLELNFPGMKTIKLPLNPNFSNDIKSLSLCQSKVCGDRIQGLDCGDEIAEWLSDVLDISGVRLIRQLEDEARKRKDNLISLNNQAQFLLINSTSVKWLSDKIEDYSEEIESFIDRFRGNLIIETAEPLEESSWNKIKIGKIEFHADGPCTRCQMICIDQKTGEKTAEPLRTIAKEFQGKMRFGVYLSQTNFAQSCFIGCDDYIDIE